MTESKTSAAQSKPGRGKQANVRGEWAMSPTGSMATESTGKRGMECATHATLSPATQRFLYGAIGGEEVEHDADHDRQLYEPYQPRVRRMWANLERSDRMVGYALLGSPHARWLAPPRARSRHRPSRVRIGRPPTRRRGAGCRAGRRRTVRSSARSGDSDLGSDEPEPARRHLARPESQSRPRLGGNRRRVVSARERCGRVDRERQLAALPHGYGSVRVAGT